MSNEEEIIKKYLSERNRKAAQARWEKQGKMTPEEKREKQKERMKEYRRRKKEEKDNN